MYFHMSSVSVLKHIKTEKKHMQTQSLHLGPKQSVCMGGFVLLSEFVYAIFFRVRSDYI